MTIAVPKPRAYRLGDYRTAMATLEAIRVDRDAAYADLAHVLGVTRQEVAKWLQQRRMPAAHRLPELAAALGYDLALVPREDA